MSRSNQLAGLITATPTATLDTINEINTSLNNDANLSTTLTNSIATKMPLAGGTFTGNVGIDSSPLATHTDSVSMRFGGLGNLISHKASTANKSLNIANNVQLDTDGSYEYIITDEASLYSQYGGAHRFYTAVSGTAGNDITFKTPLQLFSDGNVNIGGITGGEQLTLDGVSGVNSGYIGWRGNGAHIGFIGGGAGLGGSAGDFVVRGQSNIKLNIGGSTKAIIDSSGNVGIGAASSGEILGIDKSSGDTFIRFDKSGTFKGLVGIADSSASGSTGSSAGDMILRSQNNVILDTGGTTRMLITPGGNVGIGFTTPTHTLDAYSTSNTSFSLDRNVASNASNLSGFNSFYSLSIKNRNNGSYLRFGGGGSRTEIQATDGASTPTAKNISLNTHGGNVGIGCIPDAEFQVGDAGKNIGLNIKGVFDSPLDTSNNPTVGGVRMRGGRFQSSMNNSSTALKIYDGGMGGGRTVGHFSCGIGFMHLDSNNWSSGNSTNYPGMQAWIGLQLVDTPGQERSSLTIGTTNGTSAGSMPGQRITFSPNGNIGAPTGTNIYNASDKRFKQNIVNLESALSKINQIQGVSFNWKEGYEPDEDGKTLYGFIAQDVEVVDSTLVEYFANGHTVEIGDEKVENPLRVNEKFIIPMLVEAVKELSGKVTALESAS